MSPHGTPPWGHVGPKSTTYGLDDMGELAVRMGSPVSWDRRGDVVLIDTFVKGFGRAEETASNAGSAIFLTPRLALVDGICCCIYSDGAASCGGQLGYPIHIPPASKMGIEYSFSSPEHCDYWLFQIVWYTGAVKYWAIVKVSVSAGTLSYYNLVGGEVEFATGLTYYDRDLPVNTGKLVADFETFEYTRFILNETAYDLSDLPVYASADTDTAPQVIFLAVVRGVLGETEYLYVDRVILTHNE